MGCPGDCWPVYTLCLPQRSHKRDHLHADRHHDHGHFHKSRADRRIRVRSYNRIGLGV